MVFLIRFFTGHVRFLITGSRAGSFVNDILRAGVNVWGIRAKDGGIVCCVSCGDYPLVQRLCRKTSQRVHIVSKHGLPFFINKNRRRGGLLVGAAMFAAVFYALSLFVWTVDICSFDTISQTSAREILRRVGIYEGVRGDFESLKRMQTTAMLEFGNLSWMTINADGSFGEVNATEKTLPETNDTAPRNMKASADGFILRCDAYSGAASVSAGDSVVRGDLLISGVVETELGGTHLARADGIVLAQTRHTERFVIAKKRRAAVLSPSGERYGARLFGRFIPLTLCPAPKEHITTRAEKQAEFRGQRASASLVTERIYGYTVAQRSVDRDKAFLNERLLRELFCYGDKTITDRSVTFSENDDHYTYVVDYICEENIAQPAKILVK